MPAAAELRAAVRRFIGSRVRDPSLADDLTQDALLKVHKSFAQAREPSRLMGWVIRIARNVVADHFRAARGSEPFDEARAPAASAEMEFVELEEAKLRADLAAYIRGVVDDLPPKYREALILTQYEGLSQVELARRLGLSVSAAKSRVQRARAMTREVIERCCDFDVDRYGGVVDCAPKESRCGCSAGRRR